MQAQFFQSVPVRPEAIPIQQKKFHGRERATHRDFSRQKPLGPDMEQHASA
jgi:hypothetical protein